MRQCNTDIQLGVLTGARLKKGVEFAEAIGAFSVNPSLLAFNQRFVDHAHNLGMRVYVHTVDRLDDLARIHGYGADGVFTNYPDRVLKHYVQGDAKGRWPGRADLT